MLASNQPCDQNSKQLIYLQLLCPDNHPVFHFQYSFQYIIWDSQHFMVTEALCWMIQLYNYSKCSEHI